MNACERICAACAVRLLAGWRAAGKEGLEVAFLAREARIEQENVALVQAGLRELHAPELPFRPRELALVLRLAFQPAEACAAHLLGIRPLTPDGRLLATEATVAVPAEDISKPTGGMIVRTTIVLGQLLGLRFDQPGRHAMLVFLDGALVASVPLTIVASAVPQASSS